MNQHVHAASAALEFRFDGEPISTVPYGSGHIHDTYCATFQQSGGSVRFILQHINTTIFRNPAALMENIERITTHLAKKLEGDPQATRRVLTLVPARDARAWHVDEEGSHWRAYRFIERARAYDSIQSPGQAFEAARAFGQFQQLLVDLPLPRLHETIPDFHDTPKRFSAFERAVESDAVNRAVLCGPEIAFALARKPIAGILLQANLPERITHNDTKINNVLLDEATGEGLCVIDLDTAMPGLALYDFGDMVRTATTSAREDERDLSRVTMQLPLFEAILRGYLSAAGGFLTTAEKQHIVAAGKVIAFEQGIRFLTDYLSGDPYYKVHRNGHNLDRCRTQFRLIQSIEQQEEAMNRLVSELAGE